MINSIVLSQQITLHPNSDKVIFSTEFGFTHPYSDYVYPKPELLSRGSIEYFFPTTSVHSFGLKLLGGLSKINAHSSNYFPELKNKSFRTSILFLGAGLSYARKIGYAVTYVSLVRSHLRIDPRNSDGDLLTNNFLRKYSQNQSMYVAEFGIRFIVNDFWSTNLGFNYNLTNSDYIDDIKIGKANDTFLSLFFGISIYHGGDNDEDNDGIPDKKDMCPSTPSKVRVNEFGCPIDSDTAGIQDYLNQVPNTKQNIMVNDIGVTSKKDSSYSIISAPETKKVTTDTLVPDMNALNSIVNSDTLKITNEVISDKNKYDFKNEIALKDSYFTDGKLFCFQVAAFKSKKVAESLAKQLKVKGQKAFIVEATPFNINEIWYRIRVGYFNSLEEAKLQKGIIKK